LPPCRDGGETPTMIALSVVSGQGTSATRMRVAASHENVWLNLDDLGEYLRETIAVRISSKPGHSGWTLGEASIMRGRRKIDRYRAVHDRFAHGHRYQHEAPASDSPGPPTPQGACMLIGKTPSLALRARSAVRNPRVRRTGDRPGADDRARSRIGTNPLFAPDRTHSPSGSNPSVCRSKPPRRRTNPLSVQDEPSSRPSTPLLMADVPRGSDPFPAPDRSHFRSFRRIEPIPAPDRSHFSPSLAKRTHSRAKSKPIAVSGRTHSRRRIEATPGSERTHSSGVGLHCR
jgi:hypothetical protein